VNVIIDLQVHLDALLVLPLTDLHVVQLFHRHLVIITVDAMHAVIGVERQAGVASVTCETCVLAWSLMLVEHVDSTIRIDPEIFTCGPNVLLIPQPQLLVIVLAVVPKIGHGTVVALLLFFFLLRFLETEE
jgi:hypothetical protein